MLSLRRRPGRSRGPWVSARDLQGDTDEFVDIRGKSAFDADRGVANQALESGLIAPSVAKSLSRFDDTSIASGFRTCRELPAHNLVEDLYATTGRRWEMHVDDG